MSIRKITVEYIGDNLYLPLLERDVKYILVAEEFNRVTIFEKMQTCHFIKYPDNFPYEDDDGYCSECHELMYEHYAYCPSCGAKVVR